MKIVDANVLLYAVSEDSEHHEDSRAWLDNALSGAERVGFTWVALLALVRIATVRWQHCSRTSVAGATC